MTYRITAVLFTLSLAGIIATAANAGSLTPPGSPASTMRSLEEQKPSWNKIIPAAQRFVDALDGKAVLDKETGLVWAKSPDATRRTWQDAMNYCITLPLGGRMGWRVPTIEELASLMDSSNTASIRLPVGHPFLNVQEDLYWSTSTGAFGSGAVWYISMFNGSIGYADKTGNGFVWPVRGGL